MTPNHNEELRAWEIKVGNMLYLVLAKDKPTIKRSEVNGLKFDKIIIDEVIANPRRRP
jgi:hypothetical protein